MLFVKMWILGGKKLVFICTLFALDTISTRSLLRGGGKEGQWVCLSNEPGEET